MADLSVTAASVIPGANAKKRTGVAGATITAGQVVYEDSAASFKFKLADSDASAAAAKAVGIALHGASDGQALTIVYEDDDFTPGATLSLALATSGGCYVVSDTAGGIKPVIDADADDYPCVLMVPKSASKAVLKIIYGGTIMS